MSPPFFSIIIPCRNAGATLGRTLASIEEQTEIDREVIVVDGGSTDGTKALLTSHRSTVSCAISEPDNGVYSAMNKGIRATSGRWLLFLGANDVLAEPTVLAQVRLVIGSVVEGLYCGEAEYTDGRVWRAPAAPRVLYRNFMHHQSSFYHRSIFDDLKYDESLRIQADYDLNLRLWCAGVRPTPIDVRVARCASGGLSDGGSWANYREEITVRHRHFPAWRCLVWDAGSILRYWRKKLIRKKGDSRNPHRRVSTSDPRI